MTKKEAASTYETASFVYQLPNHRCLLKKASLLCIGGINHGNSPALTNFDVANRRFNYRVNNSGIINPSGNPY